MCAIVDSRRLCVKRFLENAYITAKTQRAQKKEEELDHESRELDELHEYSNFRF
jgi:hypothetical protein